MKIRTRRGIPLEAAFLALILAQALHSVEEYAGRLYDVFPPARLVSGMISSDRRTGFLLFNAALVAFGIGCWLGPVRRGWRAAVPLAWAWVLIELLNGLGHPAWSLIRGGYTPGVATALLLLPLALLLATRLLATDERGDGLPVRANAREQITREP